VKNKLTHGSLFAGIGGFELAAKEAGIETLWNCEIEAYPRLVLKARFPEVTQYGDIRKLNGAEIEPVQLVTFGSPCQSWSVAGARQGLNGASNLFYEAVRVIREMREATNQQAPRFACMENVPGLFSSRTNGKSDFREVLNELINIKDPFVVIPEPPKGKFLTAGEIVGNGYSLAFRTVCSSRFGVAQRRRRMFLVVDFAGESAADILFEQKSERRNFTPSYSAGQDAPGNSEARAGSVTYFEPGALKRLDKKPQTEQALCLRADPGDNLGAVAYAAPLDLCNAVRNGGNQGTGVGADGEPSFTITSQCIHGVAEVKQHLVENHPLSE
jgi:DNA (cytosine-5)-methyltransferase 1